MIPQPSWTAVYDNLVASVIWILIILIFTYLIRKPIALLIRKIKPRISSEIPHVNADITSRKINNEWVTDLVLRNSGKEPAYNIYLYLFEKNSGGQYSVKNLGKEEIKAGVLGSGERLTFTDKNVMFDGCNVTADQEIWIDYDNSSKISFRVILHPPTPRGDDWRVEPPKVINRRLLSIPDMNYQGNDKHWKDIREGKVGGIKMPHNYDPDKRLGN